ncbi:MAG TPA: hypothetical protein VNI01_04740 [Elusimicrobiota bacterium]|nr:hypothetical protein [Elusimicrobiota bacterium]
MKAIRSVVAVVLFFLLFGLPAMIAMVFMGPSPARGGGPLAALGGFLGRAAGRSPAPAGQAAGVAGAPGAARAAAPGAVGGQAAAAALPGGPPAGVPPGAAPGAYGYPAGGADGGAVGGGGGSAASSGGDGSGVLDQFTEGGPIDEMRARAASVTYYGSKAGQPGGQNSPAPVAGSEMARPGAKRSMISRSGSSQSSDEELAAKSKGRGEAAHLELSDERTTGPGQEYLTNTAVQGQQAVNMAKRLGLLDGAKDHAGKSFDGNWAIRKGIPLDKYTDSFGKQSIGVKGQNTGQSGQSGQGSVDLR